MGTATSRPAAALLACIAATAAGCGGSRGASHVASAPAAPAGEAQTGRLSALRPAAAPASWRGARIPSGAVLFYPPGWRLTRGDRGTATAVSLDAGGHIVGYLNLTPRQSRETLAHWTSFRVRHNIEEGERDVRREAVGSNLRFRTGRGSCVRDSYTTVTGARYIELACLVSGSATSSVIVGAAPPEKWSRISPSLERAIAALLT